MSPQPPPAPSVIEIVGVAGSGKSSLATALAAAGERWRIEGPLEMKNRAHLRYAAHGVTRFGRIATMNLVHRRRLTWKESKYLLYVMEWSRHLSSTPTQDDEVIVLDQGPVYVLARFGTANTPIVGCESGGTWWTDITSRWADTLDVVVALDAPDSILWERIASRDRAHEALERGRSAWPAFAGSYRRSFAEVLGVMEGQGGPRILRYDTSQMSVAQIASDIIEHVSVGLTHGDRSLGSADDNGGSDA